MKTFVAPGRVNLLGEHTDYTGGLVLPMAIPFHTRATITPLSGSEHVKYRFTSGNFDTVRELAPGDQSQAVKNWSDYPVGVLRCLQALRVDLPPFHLHIDGDVPVGAGLSSSASVEVASAMAILSLSHASLSTRDLAKLCQRAENDYVNSPCGIMDQFAIIASKQGAAMLLDTGTLTMENIPLEVGDLASTVIIVCNSMVKHSVATGAYGDRRREVEAGQIALKRMFPSLRFLGDADLQHLQAARAAMSAQSFLRCRHIVTENARVRLAVEALRLGNPDRFGELMLQGHASERDDFACSCPEIDFLVETARSIPGCFGARLTGSGFDGCTVNLVQRDAAENFITALRGSVAKFVYLPEDGLEVERIWLCQSSSGVNLRVRSSFGPFVGTAATASAIGIWNR
jgi:galactokinase